MKQILCVFFTLFGFYLAQDSAKCSIHNSTCQLSYFQNIGRYKAYTGIPALGIQIIDPFELTNVQTQIMGLWNLTLVHGYADGIAKCIVTNYTSDVKNKIKIPELLCNPIVIRGHFKLIPDPIVEETCGFNIRADGNITITIDDWYWKIVYPFKVVKHNDGQIYVEGVFDKAKYISRIGNMTVNADGIKIGNWDISEPATHWLNQNWKMVMRSDIGKFINDESARYYYEIYEKFFNRFPANGYYSDNFTNMIDN